MLLLKRKFDAISFYRIILESFIVRSKQWEMRSANILGLHFEVDEVVTSLIPSEEHFKISVRSSDQEQLPLAKLDSFISEGTRCFLEDIQSIPDLNIMQMLRAEFKTAAILASEIQHLDSLRNGGAVTEELMTLVHQAEALRVDMTAVTEPIMQLTKSYCVCRQHYHGEMIGCDTCDDWYHFDCVGISELKASKAEKYVCIRCLLKQSFSKAIAAFTNSVRKWRNASPDSSALQMDRKRQLAVIAKVSSFVQSHGCSEMHNFITTFTCVIDGRFF